jgi:proteasome lid subunit RPN8/RPN11
MKRRTWRSLLRELERRGAGVRESGAFLLGDTSHGSRVVVRVVYFDDLDPNCLKGHIHMAGTAFSKLWDICENDRLRVLSDVHTHPGPLVAQSDIDAGSPAIARDGHVALVLPNLASGKIGTAAVGVHLYRGDNGWQSWFDQEASARLRVGRWL